MKINEVIINEGIADTLKTGLAKGASAISNVAGSAADAIKTGMYRNLGAGGVKGEELAVKDNFIKRFEQQFKNNVSAAKAAGQGTIDTNQMVDSYLASYGWVANPQDKQVLKTLADQASKRPADVTKLANYMYTVGSKQMRDPSGRVMPQMQPAGAAGTAPAAGTTGAGAPPASGAPQTPAEIRAQKQAAATGVAQAQMAGGDAQPQLSSVSSQVVKQISGLKGQANFDDLKTIAKSAMQTLHRQSPSEYAKLYKEVMRGSKRRK
jgi:hypothetical protein